MRYKRESSGEWSEAEEAQYERYSRLYDQRAEKLASRGEEMYSTKYSRSEWWDTQIAYKNTWRENGHTKKLSDVNKSMVQDQSYEISDAQAKAMRKAERKYIEEGNDFKPHSYKEIRQGKVRYTKGQTEDMLGYDYIKDVYHELRARGMSAKQAQRQISYTFFGSP